MIFVVYFEKLPTSQMHTFYSLVKLFDSKEDKVTETTKTLTIIIILITIIIIIIIIKLNTFFHYVNDVQCPIY